MEQRAIEILNIFAGNGYEAYIVGGYPRDKELKIRTNDIDICTSATPKEILSLFDNIFISDVEYGSVVIGYKGYKFDVTTFRKEIKYENNRHPIKIRYINDLKKDLLRRDFTINTLCIDKDGNTIDLLGVKKDIENKILKTVGNPKYRIKEDSLRILRCIRFATILNFNIDRRTKHYLSKYRHLLKKLSMNRKKEELDKIFLSKNKDYGIKLLIDLKLTKDLDIPHLDNIILCTDLLGIWCQLNVDDIYPFTKLEKSQMKLLRQLLKEDSLDDYLLYKYGLYLCTVYCDIKKLSKKSLNEQYQNLPIKSRKDIVVSGQDIFKILDKEPGKYIKDILDNIEKQILNKSLINNYDKIKEYVLKEYK